jgi:hypothetical protein
MKGHTVTAAITMYASGTAGKSSGDTLSKYHQRIQRSALRPLSIPMFCLLINMVSLSPYEPVTIHLKQYSIKRYCRDIGTSDRHGLLGGRCMRDCPAMVSVTTQALLFAATVA